MHISSQVRKPSSPLKLNTQSSLPPCEPIGFTRPGVGLITLIRDNFTLTITDIPSSINTHKTELQMVKVHINNTKHITIANIYIHLRESTSTHYKTADTEMWTHTPLSDTRTLMIIGGQPDHITLSTNIPTRVPNTTLQQTSSPDITTVSNTLCTTGHHGKLNTHYHQTTYPSSPQSTYDTTTDYNKPDGLSPTTRKPTGHNSQNTQSPISFRPTYTLPT